MKDFEKHVQEIEILRYLLTYIPTKKTGQLYRPIFCTISHCPQLPNHRGIWMSVTFLKIDPSVWKLFVVFLETFDILWLWFYIFMKRNGLRCLAISWFSPTLWFLCKMYIMQLKSLCKQWANKEWWKKEIANGRISRDK